MGKKEKNPTEPVVDGLRSDVCGVITERIFFCCLEVVTTCAGDTPASRGVKWVDPTRPEPDPNPIKPYRVGFIRVQLGLSGLSGQPDQPDSLIGSG